MGTRGPVPKRSDQVRRTNNKGQEEKVYVEGSVTVPEPEANWHPLAVQLWESMKESGQSRYYEPSDWAVAAVLMNDLSSYLRSRKRPGVKLTALMSGLSNLLVTEGDRRRVRLEIERAGDGQAVPEDDGTVVIMDQYRKMAE